MSKRLFDDDGSEESDVDIKLKTNEDYAQSYNILRKKELLQKYKDRGLELSDSDSDSESSEDEEEPDPKFDEAFFKALASLKSKDPKIYDKNIRFFDGLEDDKKKPNEETNENGDSGGGGGGDSRKKETKKKPVTLKDYEREVMLKHGGKFEEESEDDDDEGNESLPRALSPTLAEEERQIKASFKSVLKDDSDEEQEEFGGIFKKRTKTNEEKDEEDKDFTKWLAGKKAEIESNLKSELEPLKNYWNNTKLPQSEKFLRDYILSKGFNETDPNKIPTYNEIVGDDSEPEPFSEDEKELEKQAEFEEKFNFRFEEPDTEFIKRYPRTIENSVRRTDEKRKQKRDQLKDRKQQEKQQKLKELELIKEMKRKEIEEKIKKLKAVTGNDELNIDDDELEKDFDPEEHDRRMRELFDDKYYEIDEGEEKPECPSDIEELKVEDWDNYDPVHNNGNGGDDDGDDVHCEDEDFNMDCDYDPATAKQQLQQELIENTRKRKRRGRRNRFMEIIQQEKPPFNPEDEKTYGEYIDEYYAMDCEDIIDDVPCRFKYVETTPNDFGLTIEEILLAKNKELNQWASLKKTIQTRPDHIEKKEQRLYKLKAKNEALKRKIFKSIYGDGSDDEVNDNESDHNVDNKKIKIPKIESVEKEDKTESITGDQAEQSNPQNNQVAKKKKKKKRKPKQNQLGDNSINKDDVPNKKPKLDNSSIENQNESATNKIDSTSSNQVKNKKRNKNKNKTTPIATPIVSAGEKEGNVSKSNAALQTENNISQKNNKKKNKGKEISSSSDTKKDNPFRANNQSKANTSHSNSGKSKQFPKSKNSPKSSSKSPKSPFKKAQSTSGNNKFQSKATKPNNSKNESNISDERLKAYGINPKRFHRKERYGQKSNNINKQNPL